MLAIGLDDKLPNFRVDLTRLPDAAERTLAATRKAYPSLDVPFHSRWRHFVFEGTDRWARIDRATQWPDPAAQGARCLRSRDHQCTARCRRRTAMALSRSGIKKSHRPFRRAGAGKSRYVHERRIFVKSLASRCKLTPKDDAPDERRRSQRISGLGLPIRLSASKAAPICCVAWVAASRQSRTIFANKRCAASRRVI